MQSLSINRSLQPPRLERLCDGHWRRRKHGYSWRIPQLLSNGIRVARVHVTSMASNTCSKALLVQGTTDAPT